ncbi:MAG: hypothetical protein KatS3mg114_1051 [Planctomycetaceae bacterium]|nr:MAG: hypothetical protein KatS3mg114_1051 [Planctomycetaceae bacterium]
MLREWQQRLWRAPLSESLDLPRASEPEPSQRDAQRGIDESALLIEETAFKRILRHEGNRQSLLRRAFHSDVWVMANQRLTLIEDLARLVLVPNPSLPSWVILIPYPNKRLDTISPAELMFLIWRKHFHGQIDLCMRQRYQEDDPQTVARVRERIDELGQEAFDEVRAVLRDEQRIRHHANVVSVYCEFVAYCLELQQFSPELLPVYFPSLCEAQTTPTGVPEYRLRPHVDELVNSEFAAQYWLNRIRPAFDFMREYSARDWPRVCTTPRPQPSPATATRHPHVTLGPIGIRRIQREADKFVLRQNLVRAVLLYDQAATHCAAVEAQALEQRRDALIAEFAQRLQVVLDLTPSEVEAWRDELTTLFLNSSLDPWDVSGRLLYDLQAAWLAVSQHKYRMNTRKWLFSLGRYPLKTELRHAPLVNVVRHFRHAQRRISQLNLPWQSVRRLSQLLHDAEKRREEKLRETLRPELTAALHAAGITSSVAVIRTSLAALVEELLDSIVQCGYLSLGHLRDTIARSHWRLPDVTDLIAFWKGDNLLRLDRSLAEKLPGIYLPGPFYLRWLQRTTSFFFGTSIGRLVTRHVTIPFGAAFVILKGLYYLSKELEHFLHTPVWSYDSWPFILSLGTFFWLLIHSHQVRQWCLKHWLWMKKGFRFLVHELPLRLLRYPFIKQMIEGQYIVVFNHYILLPLIISMLTVLLAEVRDHSTRFTSWMGFGIFAVWYFLLNAPMIRSLTTDIIEFGREMLRHLSIDALSTLVQAVMTLSQQIMNFVERLLYWLDEKFSFQTGESSLAFVLKVIFSPVWNFVNSLIRFCVTLLIEPQINPIKHFPVVTVSHKLLLPTIPLLTSLLMNVTDKYTAGLIATVVITSIPGVFGFLAWELKENWSLYAANRPLYLTPASIGEHGETMQRLLCPGFHSGTIPKLFTKYRRRELDRFLQQQTPHPTELGYRLEHEQQRILAFFEREFLALLQQARCLRDWRWENPALQMGPQHVYVYIPMQTRLGDRGMLTLRFAEQSGWLIAEALLLKGDRTLFQLSSEISDEEFSVLETAVKGAFSRCAVDLVRAHLESTLRHFPHSYAHYLSSDQVYQFRGTEGRQGYDINEDGLVIWPVRHVLVDAESGVGRSDDQPYASPREIHALQLLSTKLAPPTTHALRANESIHSTLDIDYSVQIIYPLDESSESEPQPHKEAKKYGFSRRQLEDLMYCRNPLQWNDWITFWEIVAGLRDKAVLEDASGPLASTSPSNTTPSHTMRPILESIPVFTGYRRERQVLTESLAWAAEDYSPEA